MPSPTAVSPATKLNGMTRDGVIGGGSPQKADGYGGGGRKWRRAATPITQNFHPLTLTDRTSEEI